MPAKVVSSHPRPRCAVVDKTGSQSGVRKDTGALSLRTSSSSSSRPSTVRRDRYSGTDRPGSRSRDVSGTSTILQSSICHPAGRLLQASDDCRLSTSQLARASTSSSLRTDRNLTFSSSKRGLHVYDGSQAGICPHPVPPTKPALSGLLHSQPLLRPSRDEFRIFSSASGIHESNACRHTVLEKSVSDSMHFLDRRFPVSCVNSGRSVSDTLYRRTNSHRPQFTSSGRQRVLDPLSKCRVSRVSSNFGSGTDVMPSFRKATSDFVWSSALASGGTRESISCQKETSRQSLRENRLGRACSAPGSPSCTRTSCGQEFGTRMAHYDQSLPFRASDQGSSVVDNVAMRVQRKSTQTTFLPSRGQRVFGRFWEDWLGRSLERTRDSRGVDVGRVQYAHQRQGSLGGGSCRAGAAFKPQKSSCSSLGRQSGCMPRDQQWLLEMSLHDGGGSPTVDSRVGRKYGNPCEMDSDGSKQSRCAKQKICKIGYFGDRSSFSYDRSKVGTAYYRPLCITTQHASAAVQQSNLGPRSRSSRRIHSKLESANNGKQLAVSAIRIDPPGPGPPSRVLCTRNVDCSAMDKSVLVARHNTERSRFNPSSKGLSRDGNVKTESLVTKPISHDGNSFRFSKTGAVSKVKDSRLFPTPDKFVDILFQEQTRQQKDARTSDDVVSDQPLTDFVTQLLSYSLAPSTKKQYARAVRFLHDQYDISPPYNVEDCLHVLKIGKLRKWAPSTLNIHLSAMSTISKYTGHKDPSDVPLLSWLRKGYASSEKDTLIQDSNPSLDIRRSMTRASNRAIIFPSSVIDELFRLKLSELPFVEKKYVAIVFIGFFALLRPNSIASMQVSDVMYRKDDDLLELLIRCEKTERRSRDPRVIQFRRVSSCHYIRTIISLFEELSNSNLEFIARSKQEVAKAVQWATQRANITPPEGRRFSGNSLRPSGATAGAVVLSPRSLDKLGNWKSPRMSHLYVRPRGEYDVLSSDVRQVFLSFE